MSIQVQNHWFFSCLTVVFGWTIRPFHGSVSQTSLASGPEWNLWIERSRLFCYSVIKFLCCSLTRKLLYIIIIKCFCQEQFYYFLSSQITFFSNRAVQLVYTIIFKKSCQAKIQKILSLKSRISKRIRGRAAQQRSWLLMCSSAIRRRLISVEDTPSLMFHTFEEEGIPYWDENQSRYSYKLSVRNIGLICLR